MIYKIKYEVDPHNRLVAIRSRKESGIPKYRQVLDGRFTIDKNSLTYHIKKSADYDLAQQIKFSGGWSLDKNHNLVFTLDKWNNQCEGNRLTLKGGIIDVKSDELGFCIITKDSNGKRQFYTLRITGSWQADENNRLEFYVEKEKARPDTLTLQGAWEVNRKNQITYTYAEAKDKTGALTFKGHWDITEKNRVSYVLNKALDSRFDFKVGTAESLKNALRYELYIGGIPKRKIISLYGRWNLDRRLGVLFEMEYEDKKAKKIIFGASLKTGKSQTLDLKLKNRLNEYLGIEVKFSKDMLKGYGEAFSQVLYSKKEKAFSTGIGFRW